MKPPTVVERYFQCRYKTDDKHDGQDQLILSHSNRICILCLADSHPIIQQQKTVSSVNYNVNGQDRLSIKLSGKGKKGAHNVKPASVICQVSCTDGTDYMIRSSMKGQLIEVNENLVEHPQLLTEKPRGTGFLAIILPYLKSFEDEMKKLKTEEEYQQLLTQRTQDQSNSTSLGNKEEEETSCVTTERTALE